MTLRRDFLRAQVFLDGDRIIGAALHGRIVAHDHAVDPVDPTHTGDQPTTGRGPAIHPVPRRRTDLQKRAACIKQVRYTVPRQHLAPRDVAGTGFFTATLGGLGGGFLHHFKGLHMRFTAQLRYSGLPWSKSTPSLSARLSLPSFAIPPRSRCARCIRFHDMIVVLRAVNALSNPARAPSTSSP